VLRRWSRDWDPDRAIGPSGRNGTAASRSSYLGRRVVDLFSEVGRWVIGPSGVTDWDHDR
jgi:hypothetical protein